MPEKNRGIPVITKRLSYKKCTGRNEQENKKDNLPRQIHVECLLKSHCPQKSTNFSKEIEQILSEFLVICSVKCRRQVVRTSERLQCIRQP